MDVCDAKIDDEGNALEMLGAIDRLDALERVDVLLLLMGMT